MPAPLSLPHAIDRCNEFLGRALAWLTVAMVAVTALVVLLRYGFNIGFIALQESVTYLHACVFMLGIGFTLKRDGHVRVDIFYRHFGVRGQAWVNALGTLVFLLPLCGYILFSSWDYVLASWAMGETSPEPGGIPAVFLLKSLIPLLALTLAAQGVAELLRNALILTGRGS